MLVTHSIFKFEIKKRSGTLRSAALQNNSRNIAIVVIMIHMHAGHIHTYFAHNYQVDSGCSY